MKDPPRLRDADGDAPAELQALFEAGARDLPGPSELARLAGRLDPVLRAPAPTAASGAATAGKAIAVVALVIGGAIGVASSFGDETPVSPAGSPAGPQEAASAEEPAERAAPAEPSAPARPPSEPAASAPREPEAALPAEPSGAASRGQPRAQVRPGAPAAESEAALLERARRALASDPARALALTAEHKARFANGVLAQEREVIAIEALRKLERGAESERRANDFGERYPDSAHRRKLDGGAP